MKIVTWNLNSVKARAEHLVKWLSDFDPDVVLLQELKNQGEAFPAVEVQSLGYKFELVGQKTYNGVGIISKGDIDVVLRELPGEPEDEQARYIEADTLGVRIASIYFPNGNPIGTEKFDYKIRFMKRVIARTQELLRQEIPFVLGGDYNVAPDDGDVFDPVRMAKDAICQEEARVLYRQHLNMGLTNSFKLYHPESGQFSWWDYRGGGWNKDHGVLIDHLLCSPQAADLLVDAGIDKTPRGWEKASDHTPVWCELDLSLLK